MKTSDSWRKGTKNHFPRSLVVDAKRMRPSQWLQFPSVFWHCWLGDRKGIWPVKKQVLSSSWDGWPCQSKVGLKSGGGCCAPFHQGRWVPSNTTVFQMVAQKLLLNQKVLFWDNVMLLQRSVCVSECLYTDHPGWRVVKWVVVLFWSKWRKKTDWIARLGSSGERTLNGGRGGTVQCKLAVWVYQWICP